MIPFGYWLMVTDPCPGCGRRMTGGARKTIQGERRPDGRWVFWTAWEFTCRECYHYEGGMGATAGN